MCECKIKSKKPLAIGKGFHYVFTCKDSEGNSKTIELDSSNDASAKALAELECSGVSSINLISTDKIINQNHLISSIKLEESNFKIANSVILDPTKETQIAQMGQGMRGCSITMEGRWYPGYGHPSWDANGSSVEKLNGVNKWSVLFGVYSGLNQEVVGFFSWQLANSGSITFPYIAFPTNITAFMNDDMHNDNFNDGDNPMRANVRYF